MSYTKERLDAMQPDQLKAALLEQQTANEKLAATLATEADGPGTVQRIKDALIAFNTHLLEKHGVSATVAGMIATAVVTSLANLAYILAPVILTMLK